MWLLTRFRLRLARFWTPSLLFCDERSLLYWFGASGALGHFTRPYSRRSVVLFHGRLSVNKLISRSINHVVNRGASRSDWASSFKSGVFVVCDLEGHLCTFVHADFRGDSLARSQHGSKV